MKSSVETALKDLVAAMPALRRLDALNREAAAPSTPPRLVERGIYKAALAAGLLEWMTDFTSVYLEASDLFDDHEGEEPASAFSVDIEATYGRLRSGRYTLAKTETLAGGIERCLAGDEDFLVLATPILQGVIVLARHGKEQITDYLEGPRLVP